MIWFDKENPNVVFMDTRELTDTLCDGRKLIIAPDIVGDFKQVPFCDNSFRIAIFDPPHLIKGGDNSWLVKKYGKLPLAWESEIKQGFDECMRVLKPYGLLVFKWNEEQIKLSKVLTVLKYPPLFGDRRSKTIWIVFMKGDNHEKETLNKVIAGTGNRP